MTLIYGKRVAKIKEFTDQSHNCTSCKAFDLRVKVFREYYHFFFIPFVAFGDKTTDIRCNQCTEPIRTEALRREHEKNTKTPFYMFTLAIFIAGLITFFVTLGFVTHLQTKSYIANPKAGDVYLVYSDKEGLEHYYYLRVAKVQGDKVTVYKNNMRYVGASPDKLSNDDYFVQDHLLYFTKAELQQMLDTDEIMVAKRGYGDEEGFNRVHNFYIKINE